MLARALASAGVLTLGPAHALAAATPDIGNVTGLYAVEVARVVVPGSAQDGGRRCARVARPDRALRRPWRRRPLVPALQLVLADGRLVEANRQSNAECFRAAIGGYGAVGVITEIGLDLADNVRIEREVVDVALERYADHFAQRVRADPSSLLHNADLALRPVLTGKPIVRWLNREASLDVAELEPRTRRIATYVLQEYFIPERNFLKFARAMAATLVQRQVAAVNVSIRYSPADTVSLLPWAAEDVFSFVPTTSNEPMLRRAKRWATGRASSSSWRLRTAAASRTSSGPGTSELRGGRGLDNQPMIRLIVGLGNPGPQYDATRHNAGFWFVDDVARKLSVQLAPERSYFGHAARASVGGQSLWLLEPATFMNLSGKSVAALARFFKIEANEILVAHDELDLLPGQVKMKLGGSHAGHNGLKDIQAQLGSADFWRLRLGIGHPGVKAEVIDYVLRKPSVEQRNEIGKAIDQALAALDLVIAGDMERAMMKVHARPPRPKPVGPPRPTANDLQGE